jgi:hypothetical protein
MCFSDMDIAGKRCCGKVVLNQCVVVCMVGFKLMLGVSVKDLILKKHELSSTKQVV